MMNPGYEIKCVDQETVDRYGFFCYMSKPKSPGYIQKRAWLEERFAEGMKIQMLHEAGGRDVGFIEYIPGEYAWRAVHAPGYLVIHCLWVVGKGKGKGYGARLLETCLEDARRQGKHGVVMISSDGNWLAGRQFFLNNGFEELDQAPPSFQLLVKRFHSAPLPSFPGDWEARQAAFGTDLVVIRTPQCPYIENATAIIVRMAQEKGLPTRVMEFQSAQEVQNSAPCPFGVFSVLWQGRLFSYHYLSEQDFEKRFNQGGHDGKA